MSLKVVVNTSLNGVQDGLQPQRTALAWSRTSLVMLVNMLLLLRLGADILVYCAIICLVVGCALALMFKRKVILANNYRFISNKVMIGHSIIALSIAQTALIHAWYVCRDLLAYVG